MQQKLFSAFAIFSIFSALTVEARAAVSLLRPGTYHKDEIAQFEPSGIWTGILKSGDGKYSAKAVTVKMTKVADAVAGEGSGEGAEMTAIDVTTEEPDVQFLLRGFKLPAGGFPALELAKESLKPGEIIELALGGKRGRLSAVGKSEKLPAPDGKGEDERITDYEWKYEIDGKSQVIAKATGFDDTMFKVLWAGDLNGDGLPDIIADTSDHYNQTQIELFLSQKSGKEPQTAVFT